MAPKRDAVASRRKQKDKLLCSPKQSTGAVFQRIIDSKPLVNVVRDTVHQIWFDPKTLTVFDPVSRAAVGVHVGNGQVRQLNVEDLELAKEQGWQTAFVENLKQLKNSSDQKN
jgi:hypothetical protein